MSNDGYRRDLTLVRGAIHYYEAHQHAGPGGEVYPAEVHKTRPFVLMDRDPWERFCSGLELHVVPLSTKTQYDGSSVHVKFRGKEVSAVTCQATTIDSERLAGFKDVLEPAQLDKISRLLNSHLDMSDNQAGRFGCPGSVVDVPWNGENRRTFVIVGSAHLDSNLCPILATPLDSLYEKDGAVMGVKPRPLALRRMKTAQFQGELSNEDSLRLQVAVRQSYGLPSP